MSWRIVFTKQAQKDAKKLSAAGLRAKADALIEILRENPYQTPPTYEKLVGDLTRELEIELDRLSEKLHARLLEQIFIEERLYKQIEEVTTYENVVKTVDDSLKPFLKILEQPVTKEDIERLLEIRIKRICRYDIDRQAKEVNLNSGFTRVQGQICIFGHASQLGWRAKPVRSVR